MTTCPHNYRHHRPVCELIDTQRQLDECRETVKRLNRRCQGAEACPVCRRAAEERERREEGGDA